SADSTAIDVSSLDQPFNVPIGKPIHNTSLYVLDDRMEPSPIGIPGEIYLGGDGLAQGYLFQPELTAERFVPDPYSNIPGSRLYRTRDIGRYRSDGEVEYTGRADRRVKVRGMRVDLGEVESVLGRHPALGNVAVTLDTGSPAGERLVAYVVANQTPSPTSGQLREFVAQRLPQHMVPSSFVMLEQMPLTPNGKIDRRRLPAPPSSRDLLDPSFVPPRNPVEQILAQIWKDVLSLDSLSVDDNFFAVGGHSLLATQIISRIRSWLSVDLPLRSIFEAPSISLLARQVISARDSSSPSLPPILPAPRASLLPLSFPQHLPWFLDQLCPHDPTYNIPGALRIRGPLDLLALESSLSFIISRHDVLRTSFDSVAGQPVQIVSSSSDFNLQFVRLSVDSSDLEALALDLALAEARRPFSLSTGPLIRACLISF